MGSHSENKLDPNRIIITMWKMKPELQEKRQILYNLEMKNYKIVWIRYYCVHSYLLAYTKETPETYKKGRDFSLNAF